MSYTKQNFIDGMVLTAKHLNHMEQGIWNVSYSAGNAGVSTIDCFPSKGEVKTDPHSLGAMLRNGQVPVMRMVVDEEPGFGVEAWYLPLTYYTLTDDDVCMIALFSAVRLNGTSTLSVQEVSLTYSNGTYLVKATSK